MIIVDLALSLVGGGIYRLRGMEGVNVPRPILQGLFSVPFAWSTYFWYREVHIEPSMAVLCALLVFISTTAAVCSGHGNFQDLGTWTKAPREGQKYEKVEYVIAWLKPHMSPYWYDFLGMCVSGMSYTLPLAVALAAVHLWLVAVFVLLSGVWKGFAYMLGWCYKTRGLSKCPTCWGEFLTGFYLWLTVL